MITCSMNLSLLASSWCSDSQFIEYLNRHIQSEPDSSIRYGFSKSDLDPAAYIAERCKISSSAMLDTNPAAAKVFDRQVRQPYLAWLQERKTTNTLSPAYFERRRREHSTLRGFVDCWISQHSGIRPPVYALDILKIWAARQQHLALGTGR